MTAIVSTILTAIVPILSRLFLMWLDGRKDSEEAKKRFLAFIDVIRADVPNKLFKQHYEDIRAIRRELGIHETENNILKDNLKNYRDAYEKTYQEKLTEEEKGRKLYSDNLKLEDELLKLRRNK